MVYRVINKKSVIVPHEVTTENVVSPLGHTTHSDKIPEATIALPPVLGSAMIESEQTEKHWEEVTKDLQARADDAAPREKEMDKIDTIAAGKERDYDYTHPIVDNIYTGKLILDEGLNRKLVEDENGDESYNVTFNFNTDDFIASVETQLTLGQGMTQRVGGIYPGTSANTISAASADIDREIANETRYKNYLNSSQFEEDVNKEVSKIMKEIADEEKSSLNLDDIMKAAEEKALSIKEKNLVRTKIKSEEEIKQILQDYQNSDQFRKDAKKYYNKVVDEYVQARFEFEDPAEIRQEAESRVRERAQKKFGDKAKVEKSMTPAITDRGVIDTADSDAFWVHYHINGTVISDRNLVAGQGNMNQYNPWVKYVFDNGAPLMTKGEPLGIEFAERFLELKGAHWMSSAPTNSSTKDFLIKHPFIMTDSGNSLDYYIAMGKCSITVPTEADAKKLERQYRFGMVPDENGKMVRQKQTDVRANEFIGKYVDITIDKV